jgi:hypothetical protein
MMSANQFDGPDVDHFRYKLIQESRAILDRALADADQDRSTTLLETIYEVWGLNLGALEGMACLRGLTQERRHQLLRQSVLKGKEALLEEHRKECKGCSGSQDLEDELRSLN